MRISVSQGSESPISREFCAGSRHQLGVIASSIDAASKAVREDDYPCQTWLPQLHVTVSVGCCLVNCFLQMGHGLVITYVMVFTPRLNHSMATDDYKFIVSSGM